MRTKMIAFAAALSLFAACDSATDEYQAGRRDKLYQEAMKDYSAGRLEAAQKGFEKVVRADPGNAMARFQLACMLQDRVKDHLAAYCQYREFLALEPKSDKAALAKERAEICRREVGRKIADELSLDSDSRAAKEIAAAKAALKECEAKFAKAAKSLEETNSKCAKLLEENARLRRMVSSVGSEESRPRAKDDVKSILDDDGPARPRASDAKAVRALLDDDGGVSEAAKRGLAEAKELVDDDDGRTGSEVLDGLPKAGRSLSDMTRGEKRKDFGPARPESYVVQEGDTLYRIAMKFYGRSSAWKLIREANKTEISNDGRVKAGQRLVLP